MNAELVSSLAASYAWSVAQVTLVATVALVIYFTVRQQSPTEKGKLLAGCCLLIVLLTGSFLSPWPRWNLGDWTDWPASEPKNFRISHYERQTTTAIPLDTVPLDKNPLVSTDSDSVGPSTSVRTVAVAVPIDSESSDSATNSRPRAWLQFALASAATLSLLGLFRFACGLWSVRRFRRTSQRLDDQQLQAQFAALAKQLQIKRPIELRESNLLIIPATIGWRRPLVLVPATFRDWTADQRRTALAHELAHVAERHYPAWLVAQLAVAVNFYHPLVHWLVRRLRLEQELAADALAVRVFADRRLYANTLASLALAPTKHTAIAASLGLFMSRPFVLRRIAMLRQQESSPRRSRLISVLTTLAVVATAACAIGLRSAPAAPKEDATSPDSEAKSVAETSATDHNDDQSTSVSALFQVSRTPGVTDNEWKIYCETQIAYIDSAFVLKAAITRDDIRELPLIKAQQDPLEWLATSLQVGFIPNSEILSIGLSGTKADVDQLRAIVDAVAEAYTKEVMVATERKWAIARDTLQHNYQKLSEEIVQKMQRRRSLAEELEAADQDGRARVLQELDVKRLDRIESELLRLEDEQLSAKLYADELRGDLQPRESAKLKFYEERIAQLQKRRQKLEERITGRNRGSVELEVLASELRQLQEVASDLNLKLEMMDVKSVPNRIRLIQKAM